MDVKKLGSLCDIFRKTINLPNYVLQTTCVGKIKYQCVIWVETVIIFCKPMFQLCSKTEILERVLSVTMLKAYT